MTVRTIKLLAVIAGDTLPEKRKWAYINLWVIARTWHSFLHCLLLRPLNIFWFFVWIGR